VWSGIWAHSLTAIALALLERFLARHTVDSGISVLRMLMYVGALPSLALQVLFILDGEAGYTTSTAAFSYADGAWQVAIAVVLIHAAIVTGALVVARPRNPIPLQTVISGFSDTFLWLACVLVFVFWFLRVVLAFETEAFGPGAYVARLFLAYYQAIFVFAGMALRKRLPLARAAFLVSLPAAAIIVLTGSRGDALFPGTFFALGYAAARPLSRREVLRLAPFVAAAFFGAMFIGSAVRTDERGRTGQAALERMGEIGGAVAAQRGSFLNETLGRLVSTSTHSVLTRIPSEVPHEPSGVLSIPLDFVGQFLPRFNLSGTSETEVPRNWMLNDLGFRVNWATSVELTLVADAWYRGGYVGLVVVGLLIGLVLQLVDNAVSLKARSLVEVTAVSFFLSTGVLYFDGRDIVQSVRAMVFLAVAGLSMALTARAVARRRRDRPLFSGPPAKGSLR
jgi:hypothetical protein